MYIPYLIWLSSIFLIMVLVFVKRTELNENIVTLKGLSYKPIFGKQDRELIKIDNNFLEFKSNSNLKNNNYALKIIEEICMNIENANFINTEYYIKKFNIYCTRYLSYVFLSLQLPLIINIIINLKQDSPDYIYLNLTYYVLGIVAIILFRKYIDFKSSLFIETLYKNWHDKILNYDLIIYNAIKPDLIRKMHVKDSAILLETLNNFQKINDTRFHELNTRTIELTEKINEFVMIKINDENLSRESLKETFEHGLTILTETTNALISTIEQTSIMFDSLSQFKDNQGTILNTIDNNTSQLIDLKNSFISYKDKAILSGINTLTKVSDTLCDSINKTYITMNKSLANTGEDLKGSYDKFLATCDTLVRLLQSNYEAKTAEVLSNLINTYKQEYENSNALYTNFSDAINETNLTTKKVADSIYDVSSDSKIPGIIKKMIEANQHSMQLEEAQSKILSYESITKLFENINSYEYNLDEVRKSIEEISLKIAEIEPNNNTVKEEPQSIVTPKPIQISSEREPDEKLEKVINEPEEPKGGKTRKYKIFNDSTFYGPYGIDRVIEMIDNNEINKDFLAKVNDKDAMWQPISTIDEFKEPLGYPNPQGEYFLSKNFHGSGPFTKKVIFELLENGELDEDYFVKVDELQEEWQPINTIPEFRKILEDRQG